MKLEIFQADKGDCLLLTGAQGERILVDGGMRDSFREHVAPALGRLRRRGAELDLVYVSHIDQDHIAGVLQMMDDLVAWRVHDFQRAHGNRRHPKPEVPRPPEVRRIWHNAFSEQVDDNDGEIQEMLASAAVVLSGLTDERLEPFATRAQELATSTREAIQLSRRIGGGQLRIPLNQELGGRLAMVREGQEPIALGGLAVTVIGPFEADLDKLRGEWNEWLRKNQKALAAIAKQARQDEERLSNEIDRLLKPAIFEAEEMGRQLLAEAERLGRRDKVTTPNLASLMLLVEEGERSMLLTGDGAWQDILKGLEGCGRLASGRFHADVLKVQHHGSEHNIDRPFCEQVTADHYVFCGNGEHENPDPRVVELILDSRLAEADGRRFKLWFNSSSRASADEEGREHMRQLERLVRARARRSRGRVAFDFLKRGSSLKLALTP